MYTENQLGDVDEMSARRGRGKRRAALVGGVVAGGLVGGAAVYAIQARKRKKRAAQERKRRASGMGDVGYAGMNEGMEADEPALGAVTVDHGLGGFWDWISGRQLRRRMGATKPR